MSNGLTYYVLDTETTGLSHLRNEICEYSIIRCSDRVQLSRQIKVDKPEQVSYDALRITGKTIADLKKGISKNQAINDLQKFIEEDGLTPAHRCLIGHNIGFDRKFLYHMWEQHNQSFPIDLYLDTVQLSKRLAAQMGQPKARVKLEAAMDLFGIKKYAGAHTAKGDSRNTYLLWKHLMASNIEYIDLITQHPHRKIEEVSEDDFADFE